MALAGSEKDLLLCCARTTMDTDSAARIKSLVRNAMDWSILRETALRHGVMPLLYRSLNATSPDAVPKVFLEQLRASFYANAAHNALYTTELLKLLALLETHGIPTLPFKGPVLAALVYENIALRQFGDLDILVREQDADRARDLLLSIGYRCLTQLSPTQSAAFHRARKVYELVSQDEKILVELHWAITSWTFFFPLDTGSLWERRETISLDGTPVRTVAPEDLLLLLSVHGAKHYWSKLGWITDVAELLRAHPSLHWTNVLLQANQLGARRILFLGLFLAHRLLKAELPNEIWKELKSEPAVPWLADKVQTRLFAEYDGERSAVSDPPFYFKLRERLRERLVCSLYLAYARLPARVKTALLLSAHGGSASLKFLRPLFRKAL